MTDPNAAAAAAPGADPAAASPAQAGAAQPAETSWTDGLDDAGKAFVTTKGYKAPADVLKDLQGYQPPGKPEEYELPIPDGESPDFAASVAPLMHKAQLSKAQAQALAQGWNEMQAAERAKAAQAQEAAAREAAAMAERQQTDLKREWGEKFDANVELASRAMRAGMAAAGLTEDATKAMIDTLEKGHGFAAVNKFFAALGAPFAEAKAHGLGTGAVPQSDARGFYEKSNMNP